MTTIRAISLHLSKLDFRLVERFVEGLKENSISPWTRRFVFPWGKIEDMRHIAKLSLDLGENGIDFTAFPLGRVNIRRSSEEIIRAMNDSDRLFVSIILHKVEDAAWLLKRIQRELGEVACTRIGFSVGDQPETSYFPVTRSIRNGMSASLRMIPEIDANNLENSLEKIVRRYNELLNGLSRALKIPFIGIDASISPWMEESSAALVEKVSGRNFMSIGTLGAIYKINKAIKRLKNVKLTGFNELMLPYAEDNRLMELGSKGVIGPEDLISLISVCVAGLDMVVVKADENEIRKMIEDSVSIALKRRKRIGIRIVPTDANPGDKIKLGRFGDIPVMGT
ncbi:MAG: DUF711 family protein [Candidatus Methanodesulfokora sp.]